MNKLSPQEQAQILNLLVEGNSMRSTARITGRSINTVTKLLVDVGEACSQYQLEAMRNLPCVRIQCDEIWSFCGMKEKKVPREQKGQYGIGDVYTWTAICADTKLVPSFLVGKRDAEWAHAFMQDLAGRLKHRVQLTTDGHRAYLQAVEDAFGANIDYAMLIKLYGPAAEANTPSGRYSPPEVTAEIIDVIEGEPELKHISTSFVERQNLTMRMSMRRFTRLTNGFSKKIENLEHAVALHFMHYNFGRIHKSLRVTPAMEAGIADHVWSLEEIAGLVKEEEPKKRGPYKKKISENSN
jgi:IS1 family transposase